MCLSLKKKKDSTLFIKFLDLKFLKFFFFHLFTQIRRNTLIKYIKKEKKKVVSVFEIF